jgi:hypothetical protein
MGPSRVVRWDGGYPPFVSIDMNGPNLPFDPPQDAAVRPVEPAIRASCSIYLAETPLCGTNRTCAAAAIADAAFSRSSGNVHAAMQPTSWKRPFNATISVDFKPTFRRVMFELTHRGQTGPMQLQRLLTQHSFAVAAISF